MFVSTGLYAQESTDQQTEGKALPPPSGSRLDPVFPETNTALVRFEAEEAVSTNFAKTPTLDYGASGSRTLQLNRYTELFGNEAFYAEFVFFVEEPGEYTLYYGGTPPGPEDEVYPSYTSPFSYSIDQGEKIDVHREDVSVLERYSPNFYWVKFGTSTFESGVHRMRVEVTEKRKYDGKFFFYLDSFLLIDADRFTRGAGVPKVFPHDLDGPDTEALMKTLNDYRYLVSVEPENVEHYIDFSLIYAITGDYLNALRNVNKAMLLDPYNTQARLLAAKYRLWKGEADEALKMYSILLDMQPELPEAWAEAGKVAAWVGRYKDSIDYYTRALQLFPDDLNLAVNRAITLLWASKEKEAEGIFQQVESAAAGDVNKTLELGEILIVNGYPDRAITLYLNSIEGYPDHVELYLRLVQAYKEAGQAEKSQTVYDQIRERFVPSDRLDALLESFAVKESMRERVIDGFTQALAADPDNTALREQLVQTYFWNGFRKKAIDEYHNIIINYAYITLSDLDRRSADLFELMDTLSVFRQWYTELPSGIEARRGELRSALEDYNRAQTEAERFDQKVKRAKDAGKPAPEPEGIHPQVVLNDAQSALADAAAYTSEYLRWVSAFMQRSGELLDRRNTIAQEEQSSRDSFVRLIADSGWHWDREQTVDELREAAASGFTLADYVLGRTYSIEGEYASAGLRLDVVAVTGNAPAGYAALQNSLWSGQPVEPAGVLASSDYAPYLEALAGLEEELAVAPSPAVGVYTDSTLAEVQELLARLDRLDSDLSLHIEAIDDTVDVFKGILRSRLERAMYEHQQETYLIRFELSGYYLLEGDYAKSADGARDNYAAAAEQLKLVLDIDPLNTSAVYNIGILYDRLGRWKRAMDSYAEVYEADPRFENVAAYYNQLARRHADTAEFTIGLNADATKIGQKAELTLGNEFNSVIGLRAEASTETVRMFREYSGPGDPWLYQLHRLSLAVPFTVPGIELSLTPVAGIKICPDLLNDGVAGLKDALNPAYVLSSYQVAPELGGDLHLNTGYLAVDGSYRYGRFDESFRPGVERLNSHYASASARLDFGIFNAEIFQYSSAAVSGNLDLLYDSSEQMNVLYGGNERLDLVFHLADSPWANLSVFQLLDYQNSKISDGTYYYAPDNVLQLAGGVGMTLRLEITDDTSAGLTFNVSPGIQFSGSTEVTTALRHTLRAADLRLDLTVNDITYSAVAQFSSSTSKISEFDYWSASAGLGVRARLPRLLAD